MELDLRSLLCPDILNFKGWDPATIPLHPHLGSYTRALLVSQDRRHLFVTSWWRCSLGGGWHVEDQFIEVLYIVIISLPKNLYLCKVYGEIRQLFGFKCTNILSELQFTVHCTVYIQLLSRSHILVLRYSNCHESGKNYMKILKLFSICSKSATLL